MTRLSRFLRELLLRCYPPAHRARWGEELEAAMRACLARERRRLGPAGLIYAWTRLAVDAIHTGMWLRLQAFDAATHERSSARAPWPDLLTELRYGVRALWRAPGFTLVVVCTLGLAIGAATAIFSVVNGVLLKPLPYPEADRLVSVWNAGAASDAGEVPLSATQFFTYRAENRVFAAFGLWATGTASVTTPSGPEEITTLQVTHGTLQALGVAPAIGRWPSADDDAPGAPESVVLADAYWKRHFGGDPSVIGRVLIVDARPRTIIGIMPAGYRVVNAAPDVIVPFRLDPNGLVLGSFNYFGLGRLESGATLEQAAADLARLNRIWLEAWPAPAGFDAAGFAKRPSLRPLKREVVGDAGDVLWVLLGVIGVVLLIACGNVANLLLVRAEQRRSELGVRAALGAGTHRLARDLLLESLVLGTMGGGLGLVLTVVTLPVLVALGPTSLPRLDDIGIDAAVLAFALAAAVTSSVLFGAIPVVRYAGSPIAPLMRVADRTSSGGPDRRRTRNVLVIAQVALALVLLVGAGLMVRTVLALRAVQPGFTDPGHVQLIRLAIPRTLVADPEHVFRLQAAIRARVAAIPGVSAAALASAAPMEPYLSANVLQAADRPDLERTPRRFKFVSPGYFSTVGTPMIAGRDFDWTDLEHRRPVTVVSENLARELFGAPAAALGRRLRENPESPWREVVGVAGDVFDDGVHRPAPAMAYWPAMMAQFEGDPIRVRRSITLAIRSDRTGSESFLKDIQAAVWAVNASLPLSRVQVLKTVYEGSLARTSFALVMLAIAAAMALALGLVGVYGVIAYAVLQQTRDIGIRVALGARPGDVTRMFVRHGVGLAGVGTLGGLVLAVALARVMSTLVFGVSALDPLTYLTVSAALMAAVALACYIPAQRASTVDPVRALQAP